jgi:arsenate reductase
MKSAAGPCLILAYAGCTTCKNAIKWLEAHDVKFAVRPIVDRPPTTSELKKWIKTSGLPVRKWLNTSGQSYRAIGKERIDAASDADLVEWLAKDGKLVKRPVLVNGEHVLVGFKADAYEEELG